MEIQLLFRQYGPWYGGTLDGVEIGRGPSMAYTNQMRFKSCVIIFLRVLCLREN
jgi:hypothetical protein